jgi:hypothetical protein
VRRPGLFVGVLALAALVYITLNTLRSEGPGSRGVPVGEQLPPFAAPLAVSSLDGDANVDPERACRVRGPRVLNVCELAEQGPVVLVFFAARSERCDEQVDVLDGLRARYPEVRFAAVAIRGDRADLRELVRRRGWRLPVGYDRDGAVANRYAVAICPTITFAERGGRVTGTAHGRQDAQAVVERLREAGA